MTYNYDVLRFNDLYTNSFIYIALNSSFYYL